jgi:hypothetical protein
MGYGIRTSGSITLALAVALCAPSAAAQPDPFEDYEEGTPAVDLEEPPPEEEVEEEAEEAAPEEAGAASDYSVQQWLWTLGLGTAFAYAGTTNEVLSDNKEESNRTLYLRLAPRVGFFPLEQFEVGLAAGLLTQLAAQNNFFFEASAAYHIPVGSNFAIVPALGLGGYFGSSSRTLVLPDGSELDESTGSQGFLLTGTLGVGYQPHQNLRLRSGINVSGLFGSETVESQDETLGSSAVNIGIPIELSYVFN